jgi:hypothetical protein
MKKKQAPKVNAIETSRRKVLVEGWLADGLQRSDIIKKAQADGWKISFCWGGMLDQYIRDVKESWIELSKANRPYLLQEAETKKHRLYLRAVNKGDLATARAILADLDKLHGLMVDKSIQGQVPIGGDFELTDEDSHRLAKELGCVFKKKK